jgi:RNA polymerase sigma factor for flagellar operon FliA
VSQVRSKQAVMRALADTESGAPSRQRRPSATKSGARVTPDGSGHTADTAPICHKVIQLYLPLVYQIAAQVARRLPCNVLKSDLISAGVFGLLDSLRRNGGDSGERFEWYARMRIRGAIVDELRAQDWVSRRARDAMRTRGNDESAAPAMLVSLNDVSSIEEGYYLAANEGDPGEELEARMDIRAVATAIGELPERERRIVVMHYFEGMKFKDIGALLGVSEPRISQLHARALGRLRWQLRA